MPTAHTETSLATFDALWGAEPPLRDHLRRARDAGDVGVEGGLPEILSRIGAMSTGDANDFATMLDDLGLEFLPMVFSYGSNVSEHRDSLRRQVESAMNYGPRHLTAHTGTDAMTFAEAVNLFEAAIEVEREFGIPIGHETHRGRVLHSPFAWRRLRREVPDLWAVADLSHWVVVCERLPYDLADIIDDLCQRAIHVHGRVGHPQGPQVTDPRAATEAVNVEWHEGWWSRVFQYRCDAGQQPTFTPEYGPPPYFTGAYSSGELHEIRRWTTDRIVALTTQLPTATS